MGELLQLLVFRFGSQQFSAAIADKVRRFEPIQVGNGYMNLMGAASAIEANSVGIGNFHFRHARSSASAMARSRRSLQLAIVRSSVAR